MMSQVFIFINFAANSMLTTSVIFNYVFGNLNSFRASIESNTG